MASAAVLESMYPTIDQALVDRLQLHLGRFGPLLAPVLRIQLKPRLGITAEQLRPIDRIAKIGTPVFIVAGTDDKHTTVQETRAIFDAALAPKEIWLISGAAHVDLHQFATEEYERRVLEYFATHLGQPRNRQAVRPMLTPTCRSRTPASGVAKNRLGTCQNP